MKILIVGSSNIDMVAKVKRLPLPGETLGQAAFIQAFGGKGANQAVAAARLGGNVSFITCLGNDMYAKTLLEHFDNESISTEKVVIDAEHATGVAVIMVADDAENCIAVAPGANNSLLPETVAGLTDVFDDADIVVMQAEIPYDTIKYVARLARQKGVKVLFNPAPACHIDAELMEVIDILVTNELEAEFITGKHLDNDNLDAVGAELLAMGAKNVVITLGSKGCYFKNGSSTSLVPGFKVNAIDTTGAGDVFCGALSVACAREAVSNSALQFASAAAAISVTRMGAQPSIPMLQEVNDFINKLN